MNPKRLLYFALLLVLITAVAPIHAADVTLPNGAQLSTNILMDDVTNIFVPSPDTEVTMDVPYQVAIGSSTQSVETDVVMILDVSGSTFDQDANCTGVKKIIECEIEAAIALNAKASNIPTVQNMGVIVFAINAESADVSPEAGFQHFVPPTAGNAEGAFIDQTLNSITFQGNYFYYWSEVEKFTKLPEIQGNNTHYARALQELNEMIDDPNSPADSEQMTVFFLSDGANFKTSGADLFEELAKLDDRVTIHSFAVKSDCDLDLNGGGTLRDMATATGGLCTTINDPADLPEWLALGLDTVLERTEGSINGETVGILDTVQRVGPAEFNATMTATGLTLGSNQVCVQGFGRDVVGTAVAEDCITINILQKGAPTETASCDDPTRPYYDIGGVGQAATLQPLPLPNAEVVDDIFVETIFKSVFNIPSPDNITVGSGSQSHTLPVPVYEEKGYVYHVYLPQGEEVTMSYEGDDAKPLALVAYTPLANEPAQAQAMLEVNQFLEGTREQRILPIETTNFAKTITVRFVVADVDVDARPLTLFARAGKVRQSVTVVHPNRGDGLLIYDLTLHDVAGDVERIVTRVGSPADSGDSLYWSNVSATFGCEPQPQQQGRTSDGLQMLYTFDEGSGKTVHDVAGEGLDLMIGDETAVQWLPDGGLRLNQPTNLSSGDASTHWQPFLESKALTIEFWGTPANRTQDGPARIISSGADPSHSNFMLGQSATDYTARLTTQHTSDNGLPQLDVPNKARPRLQHIVYTRDAAGVVRVYVDGRLQQTSTLGGDFALWNVAYPLTVGNEATGDRPWLGDLHLLALYSRALSAQEVLANYQAE